MSDLAAAGFDWDCGNRDKCQKRGISIAEIEAFLSGTPRVTPALKHSAVEVRYIAVGRSAAGRPMFVAFTLRTRGDIQLVRPVSARYMHEKEIEGYETESSRNDDR